MSYFARFENVSGSVFRFDTRIYLHKGVTPSANDPCIAAIVGKNPGSARSSSRGFFGPLVLAGDKMLPSVRNRFLDAFGLAGKPIPTGAFIRVWNLFYLCDADLNAALAALKTVASPRACSSEGTPPPIVWFAWGGDDPALNDFKRRYATLSIRQPFFYDWGSKRVVSAIPTTTDFAKHPQGLPGAPIVSHLAALL